MNDTRFMTKKWRYGLGVLGRRGRLVRDLDPMTKRRQATTQATTPRQAMDISARARTEAEATG